MWVDMMFVYHRTIPGEIIGVVRERGPNEWKLGEPLLVLEVEDIPSNTSVQNLLREYAGRKYDVNGLKRFYVDADGDLYDRADDGWVEYIEEDI